MEEIQSSLQAEVVINQLISLGIKYFVVCPGSRSAPYAFALYRFSKRNKIFLYVRLDERSAAYTALGLALAIKYPVAVVVTSGTAVANLLPAVVEANYAKVSLLLITANRPYNLLGTGANQTINQFGIFTDNVRGAITLDFNKIVTSKYKTPIAYWKAMTEIAVKLALGKETADPGPVQLDAPLTKPLIPIWNPQQNFISASNKLTYNSLGSKLDSIITVDLTFKTIVISAHLGNYYPQLIDLPTVAEPGAVIYGTYISPLALSHLDIEQVIVVGRPTLFREVTELLARSEIKIVVLSKYANWFNIADNKARSGTDIKTVGLLDPEWIETCKNISKKIIVKVQKILGQTEVNTGLHLHKKLTQYFTRSDNLVLGPSNTVRDFALVSENYSPAKIYMNRGTAGIDGVVSMAVGIALAQPECYTTAILGDLTFLYDTNGVLIGELETRPNNLTFVIVNDGGGGIFNTIETGDMEYDKPQYDSVINRMFTTPQKVVLADIATAYQLHYEAFSVSEFTPNILDQIKIYSGMKLIEIKVDSTNLYQLHKKFKELDFDRNN